MIILGIGEGVIAKVADSGIERPQEKLANAQIVDQLALLVDHVDDVQRFAILSVRADVGENILHRPVFMDGNKIRRHEPANAASGTSEQRGRGPSFLPGSGVELIAGPPHSASLRATPCDRPATFR